MQHHAELSLLVQALEKAGFKYARRVLEDEVVPIAETKRLSLFTAAWEYAAEKGEKSEIYLALMQADAQKLSIL